MESARGQVVGGAVDISWAVSEVDCVIAAWWRGLLKSTRTLVESHGMDLKFSGGWSWGCRARG